METLVHCIFPARMRWWLKAQSRLLERLFTVLAGNGLRFFRRILCRQKPRILLLVDNRGGAFDNSARQLRRWLRKDFKIAIRYIEESSEIRANGYDLVYVFFWGERFYKKLGFKHDRIIKEVSSHRWENDPPYGPCTPGEFVNKYLRDAAAVTCTSLRLRDRVTGLHPRIYHTPNGISPKQFRPLKKRVGPIRIGWAGNISDSVKGFYDILQPACDGRFNLFTAPGNLPHRKMNAFYNALDILAVASKHEGEPLTLIEAMAAGCFPVCTNVGIAPELIRSGENGLIVPNRTPEAFRKAFEWCESHIDKVRRAGEVNAQRMRLERSWEASFGYFKRAVVETLALARRPKFRNDDVSWDVPLERFRKFCNNFWKYKLTQVHGVTLRGRTCAFFKFGSDAVEYEGFPNISLLSNSVIRQLSEPFPLEERQDLIEFLSASPDEVALHGLYHTDYSKMTEEEQRSDITTGLEMLDRLFPSKLVRYFIAPFNRTNEATYRVCQDLGLEVLAADFGVHLEEQIENLTINPGKWYRYHHHRFYPESTCTYHPTTMESLEAALARNFGCEKWEKDNSRLLLDAADIR
jgi:Glycosyl transferases group 1/Polysaccharide deacetylase